MSTLQILVQPRRVTRHGVRLAGNQHGVADAAAGRDQAGGRQVAGAQQHARRHVDELHPAIRLISNDAVHAQVSVAHVQGIAHFQVQQRQQLGIHPHRALGRDVAGDGVGGKRGLGHAQGAAQRVARLHRFQCRQLRAVAGADHGRELHRAGQGQAAFAGLIQKWRGHGFVGIQHQISAQHLASVAFQRAADAVGQKAHAGHRGHRHHQRQHQQAQLARPGVAHHHPGAQAQGGPETGALGL
ncbi:hypothetical protein D3C86_1483420 [compost metagenome]